LVKNVEAFLHNFFEIFSIFDTSKLLGVSLHFLHPSSYTNASTVKHNSSFVIMDILACFQT